MRKLIALAFVVSFLIGCDEQITVDTLEEELEVIEEVVERELGYVGNSITMDDVEYVVKAANYIVEGSNPNASIMEVELTATNDSTGTVELYDEFFEVYSQNGDRYTVDNQFMNVLQTGFDGYNINPGITKHSLLFYEIPTHLIESATPLYLTVHDGNGDYIQIILNKEQKPLTD